MNEFTELEYKYRADDIGLKQFTDLMEELGYEKQLTISSWDIYYTNDSDDFIRLRESPDSPEMTIKRKTTKSNNWVRKEVDLPLSAQRWSRKGVEEFVALEGYSENFRIYKSCFIYWQEHINFVYYIVYDEQMREQGRFVEVEHNKHNIEDTTYYSGDVDDLGNQMINKHCNAKERIRISEKELNKLGITSKNRLKKSLFEMFRRV